MAIKKEMIAMLLAGGQGSRLFVLTNNRAKPAVPFGGKYRIIDFTLSNCSNSGIDTVGVLTQYKPMELNAYIGTGQPWDLDRMNGGIQVLPPYVTERQMPFIRTCSLLSNIPHPMCWFYPATMFIKWTMQKCLRFTKSGRPTPPSP